MKSESTDRMYLDYQVHSKKKQIQIALYFFIPFIVLAILSPSLLLVIGDNEARPHYLQ